MNTEGIHNVFNVVVKSLELKGFVETDFKSIYPQYLELAIRRVAGGEGLAQDLYPSAQCETSNKKTVVR
ncbi:unnamed protein product [Dovyalis caffra]|uniref:Uncharacterized protein n=1 Tax=Dovyalis caffra TaxID=77055 RepID=A0AAV1REC6_9ROSI|nr:unnamed protein product [Dovyalis caffra]